MMNRRTFERWVRQAVEEFPEELRNALDNIDIVIEDRPPSRVVREMGPDLLGLYEGTPLPERELGGVYLPDKISLYMKEFEKMGLTGKDLVLEIRLTVIHELGHYFGFDDDRIHELEARIYEEHDAEMGRGREP